MKVLDTEVFKIDLDGVHRLKEAQRAVQVRWNVFIIKRVSAE
jgi:hypothetical protein